MIKTTRTDLALLLLRLIFGAAMIAGHGWGKLMRLFSGEPIEFSDPYGFGPAVSLILVTFAEVLCAALLMAGLFTRWVTIPLIIAMLTVVFVVNLGEPFSQVEKPVLFLGAFAAVLVAGPGAYSLDALWKRRAG